MRIRTLVAVGALATVVVSACSGGGAEPGPRVTASSPSATTTVSVTATPVPSPSTPPGAANADALAFTAPTLDGGTLEGAAYAGGDVVLWMWAPW